MGTPLNDLLSRFETLTADAERECALDMCGGLTVITLLAPVLGQIAACIRESPELNSDEVNRIRRMESIHDGLLHFVRSKRNQLRDDLADSARNRCFASRLAGILDPRPTHRTFDL